MNDVKATTFLPFLRGWFEICVLGVVGEYRKHQFVVVTGVVSRPYGRIGGAGKIILK